jgi:4-amino-4-deoxy-L-arabinose transferase-like glycosyltransferase
VRAAGPEEQIRDQEFSKDNSPSAHPLRWAICGLAALWLAAALALALSRAPYIDEALYTFAAHSYLTRGDFGSPEIEPSGFIFATSPGALTRIDRHTYWQMPLPMFAGAAWYKLFGWGLLQQRLLSLILGAVGLWAWWRLVYISTDNPYLAGFAALLAAFDLNFMVGAISGRPDMMGHALGILTVLAFEADYGRAPLRACAAAGLLLSLAAIAHPNAGVVWAMVFAWFATRHRRLWRPAHAAAFAAPIVAVAGLFLLWASADPRAFADQMLTNGRFRTASVWSLLLNEPRRYLSMYAPSGQRFGWLLMSAPLTFVLGTWSATHRAYSHKGWRLCAGAAFVALCALTFADATKFGVYGIHVAPWFAVLSAFGFERLWRAGHKRLVACWLSVYVSVAVAGAAYSAYRNTYRSLYLPAVNAIRAQPEELVFAPPEFRFAYRGRMIYDVRLGLRSGQVARWIAVENQTAQTTLDWSRQFDRGLYSHLDELLHRNCAIQFKNERYTVYRCRRTGEAENVADRSLRTAAAGTYQAGRAISNPASGKAALLLVQPN